MDKKGKKLVDLRVLTFIYDGQKPNVCIVWCRSVTTCFD